MLLRLFFLLLSYWLTLFNSMAQVTKGIIEDNLKPRVGFKLGLASTQIFPDKKNKAYDKAFNTVTRGYPPRPGVQGGFIFLIPVSMRLQIGAEARYALWQTQINPADPGRQYKIRVTYSTFEFPVSLRYKLKTKEPAPDWYIYAGIGYSYTVREYFHLESKLNAYKSLATTAHAIFISSSFYNLGVSTKRHWRSRDYLLSAEINTDFPSASTRLIPNPYVYRLPVKYVQCTLGLSYLLK